MKMEDGGSLGVMPLKMKNTEDHQELLRSWAGGSRQILSQNHSAQTLDLYFWPLEPRGNRESCGFKPPVCLRSFLVAAPGNEHTVSNWCSGHFHLYENFK